MADNELADWLRRIPDVTRYWFLASIALPVLCRFGVVNIFWCFLDYELVFKNFQLWRPITALFAYPITPKTGFHYLIMLFFLYNYSSRLEKDHFTGRRADFLFMLIFNWFTAVILGLFTSARFLLEIMVMSVLYLWCQYNAEVTVTFYFGTNFKAMYLPWILTLFNFIVNSSFHLELCGIFVGYLYYFLTYRYPEEVGGESLLQTPSILYRWLPNTLSGVHSFGRAPEVRPPRSNNNPPSRGHIWGRGQVLGDN